MLMSVVSGGDPLEIRSAEGITDPLGEILRDPFGRGDH